MTSYKMPCIITRGNNVYGPHQFPEKLIPKFTLLASRGAPLPVHGDGGATRSYLYVEDVAEAFETVLLKGKIGETYNIGTQKERTVLDVATVRREIAFFSLIKKSSFFFSRLSAKKRKTQNSKTSRNFEKKTQKNSNQQLQDIAAIFDVPADRIVNVRDRAFNDQRDFICDKKLAGLGWTERTRWEDGLRKTVDWYLKHGFGAYWEHGDVENALRAHPGRPHEKM